MEEERVTTRRYKRKAVSRKTDSSWFHILSFVDSFANMLKNWKKLREIESTFYK